MEKIISFVLLFAMNSVAAEVDVYVYKGFDYENKQVVTPLFTFGYRSRDSLSMNVHFSQQPKNVRVIRAYLSYPSGPGELEEKIELRMEKEEKYYRIRRPIIYSEINFDVEFLTPTGLCTKRIVKGKDVSGLPAEINGTTYNGICLRPNWCTVEVDISKIVCSSIVNKNESPKVTNDKNIKTSNSTVIIVTSLSGTVFIVLVIIAIWKRCWIKRSPQGTLRLSTDHITEPFYLNMLFRRECDQEISEIDQHHYEEIVPHYHVPERVRR